MLNVPAIRPYLKSGRRVLILKIGSYIYENYNKKGRVHLAHLEPKNFGALLANAFNVDVYYGSDETKKLNDFEHLIDLRDDKLMNTLQQAFSAYDHVILWQGINTVNMLTPEMTFAYSTFNKFEKCKRSFLMTDLRLPLVDLCAYKRHKFDIQDESLAIDCSNVTLIVQARKDKEFAEHLQVFDDPFARENNFEYYRHFATCIHLELHFMPLFTHKVNVNPSHQACLYDVGFTSQGFSLMRDSRLKKYIEYMHNPALAEFNVATITRVRPADTTALINKLASMGMLELPNMTYIENMDFDKLATFLTHIRCQLAISEAIYEQFDLVPNRIFESIATKTIPLIDFDIDVNRTLFDQMPDLYHHLIVESADDFADKVKSYRHWALSSLVISKLDTLYNYQNPKVQGFFNNLKTFFDC